MKTGWHNFGPNPEIGEYYGGWMHVDCNDFDSEVSVVGIAWDEIKVMCSCGDSFNEVLPCP